MIIPSTVKAQIKKRLWDRADELQWEHLSPTAKAKHYENWTRDEEMGGQLLHYMDKGQIRVYLKDTLLKDYSRQQANQVAKIMRVLGLNDAASIVRSHVKPHGRQLNDGRLFCWGAASGWKTMLLALHERAFLSSKLKPFAVVFLHAHGRYNERGARSMIEDAATKLGIERVVWLDGLTSERPTQQAPALCFDVESAGQE